MLSAACNFRTERVKDPVDSISLQQLKVDTSNIFASVQHCYFILQPVYNYRTGALLGACACTSTGKKYALIREMHLIKSAFFNAGILRIAANMRLTANMCL